MTYNEAMTEKRTVKWTKEDKFRFTHERLRATRIPNKKWEASKRACRTNRKDYR